MNVIGVMMMPERHYFDHDLVYRKQPLIAIRAFKSS